MQAIKESGIKGSHPLRVFHVLGFAGRMLVSLEIRTVETMAGQRSREAGLLSTVLATGSAWPISEGLGAASLRLQADDEDQ